MTDGGSNVPEVLHIADPERVQRAEQAVAPRLDWQGLSDLNKDGPRRRSRKSFGGIPNKPVRRESFLDSSSIHQEPIATPPPYAHFDELAAHTDSAAEIKPETKEEDARLIPLDELDPQNLTGLNDQIAEDIDRRNKAREELRRLAEKEEAELRRKLQEREAMKKPIPMASSRAIAKRVDEEQVVSDLELKEPPEQRPKSEQANGGEVFSSKVAGTGRQWIARHGGNGKAFDVVVMGSPGKADFREYVVAGDRQGIKDFLDIFAGRMDYTRGYIVVPDDAVGRMIGEGGQVIKTLGRLSGRGRLAVLGKSREPRWNDHKVQLGVKVIPVKKDTRMDSRYNLKIPDGPIDWVLSGSKGSDVDEFLYQRFAGAKIAKGTIECLEQFRPALEGVKVYLEGYLDTPLTVNYVRQTPRYV